MKKRKKYRCQWCGEEYAVGVPCDLCLPESSTRSLGDKDKEEMTTFEKKYAMGNQADALHAALRQALVGYQITEVHGEKLQVKSPTKIADEIVERLTPVVEALLGSKGVP